MKTGGSRPVAYDNEKYLAEEFRRGGDVQTGGQSRASQQELSKFMSKIKHELNGTGTKAIITDSPSIKNNVIAKNVVLAKPSPL